MAWEKILQPKRSKVEITGLEARFYDTLLDMVTLGNYQKLLDRAITAMAIKPGDHILDLGCGTGRNAELKAARLQGQGSVLGIDIGDEMLRQAAKRAQKNPLLRFEKLNILSPLPYNHAFDLVTIAFVLHGFEQPDRLRIIDNAYRALKNAGIFYILDWNEFNPDELSAISRFAFTRIECQLASEYVQLPWKKILPDHGFTVYSEHFFINNRLRLLGLQKTAR